MTASPDVDGYTKIPIGKYSAKRKKTKIYWKPKNTKAGKGHAGTRFLHFSL